MENRILQYADGRLKESERLEMEKHLEACPACRLRVNEFRAVSALLDELPVIEPSGAFDARVHALVAAVPPKRGWLAWFAPSPRVAFAASLLLLATVWVGSRRIESPPVETGSNKAEKISINDLPLVNDYDVLHDFEPLTDLSQADVPDSTNLQM
jgi:anti-sigma factor RsiW